MQDPLAKAEALIHNLLQCLNVITSLIERVERLIQEEDPTTSDEEFIVSDDE